MTTSFRQFSYTARALLAGAVLYFALEQSAGDRGWIDFTVIAVTSAAILWNVFQLSRRMLDFAGKRASWKVQRTLLFWILGIGNTIGARPEDVGGWRTWLGAALLAFALWDTISIAREEREAIRALQGKGSSLGPEAHGG